MAHPPRDAVDLSSGLALLILHRSEINEFAIVQSLAPCIDANDQDLAREVRSRFGKIDNARERHGDMLNPPNFRTYQEYVEHQLRHNRPVPQGFVAYIFQLLPDRSLVIFIESQENIGTLTKEDGAALEWSAHLVGDAIWRKQNRFNDRFEEIKPQAVAEIEQLSRHDAWWVRLYAAHIVRLHPELAADGVVERLRADEHELVNEVLAPDGEK